MDAQELTVPSYEQPQPPLLCCCCASRTMCDATCHQFWLATCSLTDSRISFSSGKVATSMGTAGRDKIPLHHFIAISNTPGMCFCRAAAHRLHASGWQSAALGCAGISAGAQLRVHQSGHSVAGHSAGRSIHICTAGSALSSGEGSPQPCIALHGPYRTSPQGCNGRSCVNQYTLRASNIA